MNVHSKHHIMIMENNKIYVYANNARLHISPNWKDTICNCNRVDAHISAVGILEDRNTHDWHLIKHI